MKKLFLLKLFFIFLLTPFHQAKIGDYLESASIKQKIKEEVASLDIKFNAKFLDLKVFEGLGISSSYKYEVEPSYKDSYYTRIDKWKLNFGLRPGDFVKDFDLPISLNIDQNSEVLFVRQFKTQKKALLAKPYTPKRIPFKAKWALKNLEVGDFVSIPARLNIAINASIGKQTGIFSSGVYSQYLLSGEFQIHLFRMSNNKMRMRLIALRRKSISGGAHIKADFKIFGIKIIDKQIKKLIDVDLFKLGIAKEYGDLFMLDYIFDLNYQESKDAYNSVMASTLKFKTLKILNPFFKNKDIQDSLISDLTQAEDLFKADKNKKNKRIERLFKGLNKYTRTSNHLKIGFSLIKFNNKTTYTENHISYFDKNEQKSNYFYPTYTKLNERKFLWGLSKYSRIFSVSALLPTNDEGEVLSLSDFSTSMDIREKRMWGWEQEEAKEDLMRALSPTIFSQIDFGEWRTKRKRRNTRFFYQIFFHESALKTWKNYSLEQLKSKLDIYLKLVPLPENNNINGDVEDVFDNGLTWDKEHKRAINKMLTKLHDIFQAPNDSKNFKDSIVKLVKLRKNIAFEMIGNGFLISLLDQQNLLNEVSVNFTWSAKNTKRVSFEFGNHPKSSLYKQLEYVQSILNDRSFDLRYNQNSHENSDKEESDDNVSNKSEQNSAVIKEFKIRGNKVTLKLQALNNSFSNYSCNNCPESTFSNQLKSNNGYFKITVSRKWLKSKYPQLLKNKNYINDLYKDNHKNLVLLGLDFVKNPKNKDSVSLSLSSVKINIQKDLPSPSISTPKFYSNPPENNLLSTSNSSLETFKSWITYQNPAAIINAEIKDDLVYLSLQVVNEKLRVLRCLCSENIFSNKTNNNNGGFKAIISVDLLSKFLPDLAENLDLIHSNFRKNKTIYIFTGTLLLSVDKLNNEINEIKIIDVENFKQDIFVKDRNDAFKFDGPRKDKNFIYKDDNYPNDGNALNFFSDVRH
ncbi:MAG: hypothetical protein COB02_07415 [Candidatus Cloacimonadota bacterium]|nr:MAG: hypothetical protein COB02_07415 [Candidatus Cloacimonadota bacterium]